MIWLGVVLSFSRGAWMNCSVARDQSHGQPQPLSGWSQSPEDGAAAAAAHQSPTPAKAHCQAGCVCTRRSLLFQFKILHGLWEFALFCFSKVLDIQTATTSATEDHIGSLIVLCVAVFHKPSDYSCFKCRAQCHNPWMLQLKAVLHLGFLLVFYWELSSKLWH